MKHSDKNEDWSEWSKHVLLELKRISECHEKLNEKMNKVSVDVATLKVKASVWGAIGASVPLLVFAALQIITKGNH